MGFYFSFVSFFATLLLGMVYTVRVNRACTFERGGRGGLSRAARTHCLWHPDFLYSVLRTPSSEGRSFNSVAPNGASPQLHAAGSAGRAGREAP